jgi:hypothetical protein
MMSSLAFVLKWPFRVKMALWLDFGGALVSSGTEIQALA